MSEKLDCNQAISRLQDYLKHELTPALAAEMRKHLDDCPPCLGLARFEQTFLRMLETRARGCSCPDELRARIERDLGIGLERG
jgi:anti-sigma factor (TIGR02949 family)